MDLAAAFQSTFTTARHPGESRSTGLVDSLAAWLLVVAAISYIYVDAFGGMVRWLFPMMGLTMLGYFPAGIAIVALLCHALARVGDARSTVPMLATIAFALVAVGIAVLMGRPMGAILFALYIWLPFFVALALTQRRMQDRLIAALVPIFFIATFGVLLNIAVRFPWADATYEVMGQQHAAAREWTAYGMQRLAGFSRASFAASAQILIGYCVVEARTRSLVRRALWFGFGFVAIYYTTSKSPMLAMALLPATYFAIGRARANRGAQRRLIAIGILAFWLLIVVAGPVLALNYAHQLYPNGMGYGLHYSSLADRMLNTWPNAIRLIGRDWVEWIVGRGLGGIGSPQELAGELDANPGDNFAVYLFVMFGLLSLGFLYLIVRGGLRAIEAGARGRRDFALIVAMLGIGSAANVVESVLPVMVFGIACARARPRRQGSDQAQPVR